jgi:carbonic anhydrase/acetyltransferase-like protein (isoleucine patch superfamily)
MTTRKAGNRRPSIAEGAYVDESALLIGAVTVRKRASVWPCALLRADDDEVDVGEGSAVMDMAFAEAPSGRPVRVGKGCLISHGARLHGCVVEDGCLIGIGATVLDGVVVGKGSIVAAGSLVPPGKAVPPGSVVVGTPATVARQTTDADRKLVSAELEAVKAKAERYARSRGIR